MTVDEIKKALRECRSPGKCDDCPLKDNPDCITLLKWDALNAIEELEERIGIVQESMEALEKRCNALEALEQRYKALEKRNEPMKAKNPVYNEQKYGDHLAHCPYCEKALPKISQYGKSNYCYYCGRAVKLE